MPQEPLAPKQPGFNDIARSWDPMMPQTQYDDLRYQYFKTNIMGKFRPEQTAAAWADFKSKTERAKVIDNPATAQAKLTMLSAGARVQGFFEQNGHMQKNKDNLIQMMERDGLDTSAAQTVGAGGVDLAAFVALDAATGGVGGILEAGAEAGSIVAKAGAVLKGTTLANRVAKGGLTFGTFQVLSDRNQGVPAGYSFLSGAAQGVTWELGLAGVGKLVGKTGGKLSESLLRKRGQEVAEELAKPRESSAEVADVLGKPGMMAADKVQAQAVAAGADKARQQGLPLAIQIDQRAWKPQIKGVDGKGMPFTIEVPPYAEYGQPLEQLKSILAQGGQVQVVAGAETHPADVVRTLSMIRSLHNDQSYTLSMLNTIIDKAGYPMEEDAGVRVQGGLNRFGNNLNTVDVKKQFLTHVEKGLERLQRMRDADAEVLRLKQEAQEAEAAFAERTNLVHENTAAYWDTPETIERRKQRAEAIALAQKAAADARKAWERNARMLPNEGVQQEGGLQYAKYVLRNTMPDSGGLFASVKERPLPQNEAERAVASKFLQDKELYIHADGSLKEFDPKGGAPTDAWHPSNADQRQTAWKLLDQVMKRSGGPAGPAGTLAAGELRKFVQEAVAKDPMSAGRAPWTTRVPYMHDVVTALLTHETPAGTRLTATERTLAAKRIMQLWSKGVSMQAQEAAADALKGLGVQDMVPHQWRFTVGQTEAQMVEGVKGFQQGVRPAPGKWQFKDVARYWQEEGRTDLSNPDELKRLMAITGLSENRLKGMNKMLDAGAPTGPKKHLLQDPRIPAIDAIRSLPQGAKTRRNIIDIVTGKADIESIFSPGTVAGSYSSIGGPFAGVRYLPDTFASKLDAETSLYHEDLHLQLNALRQASPEGDVFANILDELRVHGSELTAQGVGMTMTDIQRGLTDLHPVYKNQGYDSTLEEAFVHSASAVRVGDTIYLKKLALWDTSVKHVREMVDAVSYRILERLQALPDAQELRQFQTRIEDLQRRTGPQRWARWWQEAVKQERLAHIDPDTGDVHFTDSRGQTVRVLAHSEAQALRLIPDHLEQHAGFEENVPSSTTLWEQMGWRAQAFAKQTLVQGSKDHPTPFFLPKADDKFRGLRSVMGLVEPMLSWASRTETKFKAAGQDLGLYGAVKDVDDAAKAGTQWHEAQLSNVSKFISHDVNRAKLITPFLSADESLWPSMRDKFGMDDKFLQDVKAAHTWIQDFRQQTGIDLMKYVKQDLPKLQRMNYAVSAVWPRGLDVGDLGRVARAVVSGDLKPQDTHFGHIAAWAIREGFEAKFTEVPLRKLTSLMNKTDAEGKSILGPLKYNVDNYIKYMKGIPDPSQQIILKTVGDFQKSLGKYFAEANKKFGTKLPEDFNYPGDLLQKYMLFSYLGGIGLRPAIWARDLMQGITNTLPVMGPVKFLKGVAALFQKGAWEQAKDAGALMGQHSFGELFGDIFQEMGPQSGGLVDHAMDAAQKLLAPSRWGHNGARFVAFHGEYGDALQAVKAFRDNKIDAKKLLEDTSMWFFDAPLQARLLKQILDRTSDSVTASGWTLSHEEAAKRIALETVDHTLWAYRRGTQPMFLRTGIGRIFGQYGLWPLSYLDYMRRLTGKLAEHPQKAAWSMALWYGANKAASATFSAAGGDVSKWFFISPAGYGGSPHLQMAQAIGQSLENSEQGRAARKTVLEYPLNFVPAYLEMKSMSKFIGEGGQFFNDDWSLTDNAVRIMGMHPKSPDLNLTPEEQLEYEAGFTHRRQ